MNRDIIGFEREDERQEFHLGKLLWLRTHPDSNDGNLKGYRRFKFHRAREAKWGGLRVRLIAAMFVTNAADNYEALLVHDILALLPLTVRQEALRALASDDGRRIKKAARLIREAVPELVKQGVKELVLA